MNANSTDLYESMKNYPVDSVLQGIKDSSKNAQEIHTSIRILLEKIWGFKMYPGMVPQDGTTFSLVYVECCLLSSIKDVRKQLE